MRKIIFAIHGIRSPKAGNWVYAFTDFARQDPRFKDDIVEPFTYGFLLATVSVIPFVKFYHVQMVKRVLRDIVAKNPSCELNVVAHSYGTELSYWAVKTSGDANGEDGKPAIMVNKMILTASVVSNHLEIPYTDTLRAGKIRQLHCYCSHSDDVCRFNPFGHSGYAGFARDMYDGKCYPKPFDDLELYNHQVENAGHCDYFNDTKYYKEWLDIIAST